jgi:uncharacterized protein
MICPKCSNEMTQVIKHGLSIDTCSVCGGVWLDKGQLGELLVKMRQAEASFDQELSRAQSQRSPEYERTYYSEGDHHRDQHYDRHHDEHEHQKYGRKKRSLWDIFD